MKLRRRWLRVKRPDSDQCLPASIDLSGAPERPESSLRCVVAYREASKPTGHKSGKQRNITCHLNPQPVPSVGEKCHAATRLTRIPGCRSGGTRVNHPSRSGVSGRFEGSTGRRCDRLSPCAVTSVERLNLRLRETRLSIGCSCSEFRKTKENQMLSESIICPKCQGQMSRGYIVDCTHAGYLASAWHPRDPVKSFWMATKIERPEMRQVVACRCDQCGFLEHYAP